MHPLRLSYEMFSDANPFMRMVAGMAEKVRKDRRPVSKDNPFLAMQEQVSSQIVDSLEAFRDLSEKTAERTFLTVFGQPALQAALGIDPAAPHSACKATTNPLHQQLIEQRIAELKTRIPAGGVREAVIRGLLYVGMSRGSVDERAFEMARRLREAHGEMSLADFKTTVREQFYMLLIDEGAALAAIPAMLPEDQEIRQGAFALIKQILGARGSLSSDGEEKLSQIARLFGADETESSRDDRRSKNPTKPLGRVA
jgi:hypothetical protein